jgi:hypothetical protein
MAEARINRPMSEVGRATGRRSGTLPLLFLAAALLALSPVVLAGGGLAYAQGRPTVAVASVVSAQASAETPLPIRIAPPGAVPAQSFLRIHGLPRTVALSEGYSIAPGAWAVPLAALSRLRLSAPAGSEGRSEVTFSLLSGDGIVLSEAKCILVIAPPQGTARQGASATLAEPLPSGAPPAASRLPPQVRRQALQYMRKGDELMATKDFSAAQHFYLRAAEMGLPEAAMAMAKRYDPEELARQGAIGLQGDPELARKWYEKARALGAPDADDYLRRISGR